MSNFTPAWFKKGFFNESLFCDDFLSIHQLLYSNGAFFTPDGRMVDPMPLRCEIFEMMREYVGANLAKKVTNVVDVLKLAAQVEDFPPVTDRIALANGTLYLDGTFQEGKPEIVRNRLPDGLPIAPELLTKWYRLWRAEHPEFEQIVFHGLRHSSATYQLLQSDGDFKSVQGNTGHATASVLMDTYAHTQDKPRLELTEKIEANFYSQDLTPAAPQSRQNEKQAATKISGREILEAIRLMDADERRELTRALFA